jgi:hypothetical protein
MKQALSAVLALLALAVMPLLAGKRILMESTDLTNNIAAKQEILLDANRMKVDMGNTVVMFLTAGGSRMIMLDKARKEYSVIDQAMADQMKGAASSASAQMDAAMKGMTAEQRAMMEQMMKGRGMPSASAAAPAPVTAYAAKGAGNVNGFACTNYEGTRAGQKVSEICAAQPSAIGLAAGDFQVMQKMREFQASMTTMPMGNASAGVMEKGVDGFPVRTTRFANGKASTRDDFKSITDASLTDADFSTGDAKKVDMPGMGGRGRGK